MKIILIFILQKVFKMSLNSFKWLTIYVLVSIPIFIIGMYISFIQLFNGNNEISFMVFILTSFNLVIALWLPLILQVIDIKR